ncbi:hypothetical protein GCM10015535_10000 [Streptomyces gelaticus]|uniref:Zf-HC2 domain-containing protein n=1 Tax=Streptomyces gelaticus TaxID=285446 RepID=A0ABQ2VTG3_9ACTN|nr:hypothetical protein [Streptomyces gelaticus]GGV77225.1 hypothetical protein GCM10015535_10000 [Streptomyces gelaticus]
MTDNGGLSCEQLREIGAELALGVLPARERAGAMDHLEGCPACREHVHELAAASDALLDLVPGREPPAGFEDRVIERLGLSPARRPAVRHTRWRRFAVAAGSAAAGLALGIGGWVLGASTGGPAPVAPIASSVQPHLLTARLTHGNQSFGQVYLYAGAPPWLYMVVDADGHSGTVHCLVQRADGTTADAGSFTLSGGYGAWGGPFPPGTAPVTGVRLTDAHGTVLATADFGRPYP